jgi:hypothetical protein
MYKCIKENFNFNLCKGCQLSFTETVLTNEVLNRRKF